MKELIKNLLRLQVIAYYNNVKNHTKTCYRDMEDIGKVEQFSGCIMRGCEHVDFCIQINEIMNELNKKEYDEIKGCDHRWTEETNNDPMSDNFNNKYIRCVYCGEIRYD